MKAPRAYEASTDFSPQHFFTAELFADLASNIESQGKGGDSADPLHRHRAYVSGAIFASVAFLEAYVNELFQHCYESPAMALSMGLNLKQVQALAHEWTRGVPRTAKYRVTQKYDIALKLLAAKPFDHGARPYQDVSLLVKIRNKLVHYEPEAFPIPGPYRPEVPTEEISKLEKRLSGKFPPNPLSHEECGYFPPKLSDS